MPGIPPQLLIQYLPKPYIILKRHYSLTPSTLFLICFKHLIDTPQQSYTQPAFLGASHPQGPNSLFKMSPGFAWAKLVGLVAPTLWQQLN